MFYFILFFSFMVAIKGGLLGFIVKHLGVKNQWEKIVSLPVLNFITEGKFISAIASGIFIGAHTEWLVGLLFAVAWFTGWAMSIGEEVGAIGRVRLNWGPYVVWLGSDEGRKLGWKKGLQRGAFLGACLVLATYSIPMNEVIVIACALFPVIYFLGNELYYRIHKSDSWFYAELLFGAVLGATLKGIL